MGDDLYGYRWSRQTGNNQSGRGGGWYAPGNQVDEEPEVLFYNRETPMENAGMVYPPEDEDENAVLYRNGQDASG